MAGVKVPADVERDDRLAFGLTGKQLAIVAAAAVTGYGLAGVLAGLLPEPLPIAAGALVGLAGAALAFVRHAGLPGDRLALAALRSIAAPRLRVLAPEGLPARWRGAPAGPRIAPLALPLRRIAPSGIVELVDGSHCLLLAARGSGFELRAAVEQAALVAAFARFLNGLAEPVQILVQSERVSLARHAEQLEAGAGELPTPLRAAAEGHAAYLRGLGAGAEPLRRHRIVLVLRTTRQPATAAVALARAAEQAAELLGAAAVELTQVGGEAAAGLLASSLDSPGPGDGVRLAGVIRGSG